MKEFIKMLKKLLKQGKKGFTLIELLVVIGILGILAAALVATIDPFEQLNKAQDANVKNTMVEYLTANIRFYATHNAYPWNTSLTTGYCTPPAGFVNSGTAGTDFDNSPKTMPLAVGTTTYCIQELVNDSELRPSFLSATGTLAKIIVSYYGTDGGGSAANANTLIACFQPSSHSAQRDALTKWNSDGITPGTNCQSAGGTVACYWCTK